MLYHKELFSSAAFLYHALVLCENTPLSRIRESLKDWVYLGETWGTFTCSALCWAKSLQSRPARRPHGPRPARTLCGVLQARVLEWAATPSSRGPSWSRNRPTCLTAPAPADRLFTAKPPRKPLHLLGGFSSLNFVTKNVRIKHRKHEANK